MEDQERGMEAGELVKAKPKKKRESQKGLTIMVIRRVGKVQSFEISGRSVIWVIIFLILFIPTSIFFSNSYFQLRTKYSERSQDLQQAKDALDKAMEASTVTCLYKPFHPSEAADLLKQIDTKQSHPVQEDER